MTRAVVLLAKILRRVGAVKKTADHAARGKGLFKQLERAGLGLPAGCCGGIYLGRERGVFRAPCAAEHAKSQDSGGYELRQLAEKAYVAAAEMKIASAGVKSEAFAANAGAAAEAGFAAA